MNSMKTVNFTNFLIRRDTFFLSMPFESLNFYVTPCKVSSKSEHVTYKNCASKSGKISHIKLRFLITEITFIHLEQAKLFQINSNLNWQN